MMKDWNIGKRLTMGFGVLIIIFVLSSVFMLTRIQYLADFTEKLYRHPFTVSTTILRLKVNLLEMRRIMRDFILEDSTQMIDHAIRDLATEEKSVEENLVMIRDRFLGDMKSIDSMEKSFEHMVVVYHQALDLGKKGKRIEAIALIHGLGKEKVLEVYKEIEYIDDFAVNKAESFLANANDTRDSTMLWMSILVGSSVVLGLLIALFTTRGTTRPISEAITHMKSVGTELENVARQQASAATQQNSSIAEVSATSHELVASAKQIGENTQRVSSEAKKTLEGGQKGKVAVDNSQAGMQNIKKQVQMIAQHMLDLGNKSQRIGVVLEIIDELSEQTNLLSLNAAIEAAGAGDAGRRFAVVADEVRKLAERAMESTGEIKELVQDIQKTANTTIMVTEDGTKVVDEGLKMFNEVSQNIDGIVQQANSTAMVAREIEMTTRQQTSSIEQVSTALNEVGMAAKQTEMSANQTLETVRVLVDISRDLEKLVDG
ncbi:MAG: methyl-accepting chemotaxis protein [SAR324 cluster bacterium]|nr:methyl-accepting chemotaxis protein [SAR324 cluster bacterium]